MTLSQQNSLHLYWPFYGLDLEGPAKQFNEIFGNDRPVIFDIGFGMGESLIALAKNFPEYNFIGVDVHRPGVGALLAGIHHESLKNIRVFCGDVMDVLNSAIQPKCLQGILLFFPDPWPKKRHHKRRLVQPLFIQLLAEKLQENGILHIATDWQGYTEHIQSLMSTNSHFLPVETSLIQRPMTKYEERGKRLGHPVWDLIYQLK